MEFPLLALNFLAVTYWPTTLLLLIGLGVGLFMLLSAMLKRGPDSGECE